MFQTEINHFLQSFASDGLSQFMRIITNLGYPSFLMILLVVVLFSFNFRKGFILFLILIWTAMITFFFKDYFDLPRPFHVDNTLQLLDGQLPGKTDFEFSQRGATSFWSGLPADVLIETRASEGVENGFPSGHTSGAIALWGAIFLLFPIRWIRITSVMLMILIPLSRMYLGVHFLADVVGGLVLGGAILYVFYRLVLHPVKLTQYLNRNTVQPGLNKLTALLLLAPLIGFLFLPSHYYLLISSSIGLGIGYLLVGHRGLPIDKAMWWQRIGRTVIGVGMFAVFTAISSLIENKFDLTHSIPFEFTANFISSLVLIWLGTELAILLGWFSRRDTDIA